jgi:hypothetical protein
LKKSDIVVLRTHHSVGIRDDPAGRRSEERDEVVAQAPMLLRYHA